MKPRRVIRSRVKRESLSGCPSTVRTVPSGARMMRWSWYVPGSGRTKSIRGGSLVGAGGAAASHTIAAAAVIIMFVPGFPLTARSGGGRHVRRLQDLGAELHVVRAPQLLLGEVHLERGRERLAVPPEGAQELLVVGARLVPVREQRRGDVDAGAVPALRDHVHLGARVLLVGLLRGLRVREVEVARHAVHERVHPEALAVLADADVDGQRDLRGVADGRDLLGLPLA